MIEFSVHTTSKQPDAASLRVDADFVVPESIV